MNKSKIVFFSDLHYAPELPVNNGSRIERKLMWYAKPMLEQMTNIINNEIKPDIAVYLGDFVEDFNDHDKDIENLKFIWNEFQKIDVPLYACIGNHDLRSMSTRTEVEQILGYDHSTFSFDMKGLHIVVLGTFVNNALGNEEGGIYKTQFISDDDIKTLKKEYEEALTPVINKYDAELESIEYKGDAVVLMIITSIREKAKIDLFIDDIVTVNNTLNSLPLNISFKTSSFHYTCKAEISSDDSITIKDDRRNEMTDEEAEDFIQDFLPKLSKASKKHDAKIAEITVENDTLNVDIAAEYQDKKKIEKLEQSVNSVFEKKKSIKAVIRITTDNEFDTTKEWSIDTNGVIDVMWDFTE